MEGKCDNVSFGPDGCVSLEGHVHLRYQKDGHKAEVKADQVWVRLADMSIQINAQGPMPCVYPAGCN